MVMFTKRVLDSFYSPQKFTTVIFSFCLHRRLQCPKAGLFQCSSTGLVFLMEGKGDVVYKVTQWDRSLLGSMTPAGPLFSIDCPEQSVCKLHLPHCMCDEKDDNVSVAHVTDGNMEIVQPLKTTATHVIVNITHLSLFGLIRDVFSFLPVRSQVLLFLRPQGNRPQKRILNVILLPKNVPLCEVISHNKNFLCAICPATVILSLCYCLHLANIIFYLVFQSGQLDYDYSPNFHPTFQVFLDCMSGAEAVLKQLSEQAFVDKHMADLIQRVKMVLDVADDLLLEEMIPDELHSRLLMAGTSQEQMRLMSDALQAGGTRVKSAFYKALLNHEPRLVQDLGKIKLLWSPEAQLVEHGACNARIMGSLPMTTHM
uniref:CARD domain-containing protein n=1 Tax=Oncorhynchus mykiss TaxID=8022 RepID=A0A8C7NM70_ONCMY